MSIKEHRTFSIGRDFYFSFCPMFLFTLGQAKGVWKNLLLCKSAEISQCVEIHVQSIFHSVIKAWDGRFVCLKCCCVWGFFFHSQFILGGLLGGYLLKVGMKFKLEQVESSEWVVECERFGRLPSTDINLSPVQPTPRSFGFNLLPKSHTHGADK